MAARQRYRAKALDVGTYVALILGISLGRAALDRYVLISARKV